VDQSIAVAHDSQRKAAQQVTVIESKITDPALKQEVVDLHSTISDFGFKLDDATAKLQWYEGEYQVLYADNTKTHAERDWFKADDDKHIAGETFWRKRAQVILYFLAIAGAWWSFGQAKRLVPPASGTFYFIFVGAATLLGAAVGYAFGLYVLGWIARFLP
jgi:hypothetical protein